MAPTRVCDCCSWLEQDAGGVLVWCTRCCKGGEMVFLDGIGEEKWCFVFFMIFYGWDKGIPSGFGSTECLQAEGFANAVCGCEFFNSVDSPYLLEWVPFIYRGGDGAFAPSANSS